MASWPFNTLFLKDITVGARSIKQQDVLQWASVGKIRGILGAWVSNEIDTKANYNRLKRKLGPDESKWPKRLGVYANEAAEWTPEEFKALDCQAGAEDLRQWRRLKVTIYELDQSAQVPGRYEEDDSLDERKWRFQMCLRLLLTCLIDIEENPGHEGWFSGRVLKIASPEKAAPQRPRPTEANSTPTRRRKRGFEKNPKPLTRFIEKITSERNNRPPPSYNDAAPTSRAPSYGSHDSSPLFVPADESHHEAEQATEHDERRATKTTGDREKEDQPAQVEIALYEATIDSLLRELATTKRKLEATTDTLSKSARSTRRTSKSSRGVYSSSRMPLAFEYQKCIPRNAASAVRLRRDWR